MASSVYLASMIVMGVLALLVVAVTALGRDWYDYTPRIGRPEPDLLTGLSEDPRAWVVIFLLLVLLGTGATLSALSGGTTTLFLAVAGLLVLGFLVVGVYAAGRARGHPHAYAVGEVVITLGFVFLIALAGFLFANFGA